MNIPLPRALGTVNKGLMNSIIKSRILSLKNYFPYFFLFVNFAAIITATYYLCGNNFFYNLDDPYISIGLAKNIALGHYGLSLEEFSSPSSSIIWPFLLAPFSFLPQFDLVPLFLNIFFSFLSLLILEKCLIASFANNYKKYQIYCSISLVAFSIGLNLVGTAITGLEHSLQTLIVITCAYGIISFFRDGSIRSWFILAIFLSPLVRYELFSICTICCVLIFFRGKKLSAVIIFLLSIITPVIFSLFLKENGLSYLPNSVLVKMFIQKHLSIPILTNIMYDSGTVLFFFILISVYNLYGRHLNKEEKILVISVVAIICGQMVFGNNSMARYSVYTLAFSIPILIFANRKLIKKYFSNGNKFVESLRIFVGILCCLFPFAYSGFYNSPIASRTTHLQQHQMTAFVRDFYKQPVAVNDIGYINFYQKNYVLDLVGLDNEQTRKFVMFEDHRFGNNWMELHVKKHNIGLAMIYSDWFGGYIPLSWKLLGSLCIPKHVSFPYKDAWRCVDFYSTQPENNARVLSLMKEFSKTLPKDVEMIF